jgi:hypothetical protein
MLAFPTLLSSAVVEPLQALNAPSHQRTMTPDYFTTLPAHATSQPGSALPDNTISDCSWSQCSAYSSASDTATHCSSLSSSDTHKNNASQGSSKKNFVGRKASGFQKLCNGITKGLQRLGTSLRNRRTNHSRSLTPTHWQELPRCSDSSDDSYSYSSSSGRSSDSSDCSDDTAAAYVPRRQHSSRSHSVQYSQTLGYDWSLRYTKAEAAVAYDQYRAAERALRVDAELKAWRRCDELWLVPGWVGCRSQRACGCRG